MSTITAGKFSYSSSGLLWELEPRCTQAAITKRLLIPDQVNVKWLKAQCAHYGLKVTGAKDELEARLRKAVTEGKLKTQPKEMRDMEKGLKAAFEARSSSGGKDKGKVEKKPAAAAAATSKKEVPAKKGSAPATMKKSVAAVAKAKSAKPAAVVRKESKPPAAAGTAKKKWTKTSSIKAEAALDRVLSAAKPRVAFADQLLGTYAVTCHTFPGYPSTLRLVHYGTEPTLTGSLDLGGLIRPTCVLDWLPMAKQSRVPFSCDGNSSRGEMEFKAGKSGIKVKGRIESGPWGDVEWTGIRMEDDDGQVVFDGDMDFVW